MAHPVTTSGAPSGLLTGPPAAVLGDLSALGDLAWNLRPEVALPLIVAAGLYALGGWRLARRSARAPAARIVVAAAGLAAVAVALLSPLDALADRLFVAHMIQHMLLMMVAAPALLLADPFPVVVWGLPGPTRHRLGRWLGRGAPFRRVWVVATTMPVAWLLYTGIVWAWHLPFAYDAALSDRLIHDAEHAAFFFGSVLFWWPVVHPAPRFRRAARPASRIVYLVLAAFQTAALGLLLTLAPAILYRTYATAARPDALGALDDQAWGGVVMWGLGGLIDMIAVLVLLYRSFGADAAGRLAVPALSAPGSADSSP
ncbi:MAG: cytochrome c oxidase assembly protein [Candidatus Rokuibacteriota bacterium]